MAGIPKTIRPEACPDCKGNQKVHQMRPASNSRTAPLRTLCRDKTQEKQKDHGAPEALVNTGYRPAVSPISQDVLAVPPQTRSIGGTFKFTFPLPKPANEGNTRLHKSKAPKPGPKSRADVAQSKPAAKTARTNITPKRVRLTPEERQERARARAVEARNKLKEAGLCRDCRQRAIPGQTRCPDCAEKHRQSRQAQRK